MPTTQSGVAHLTVSPALHATGQHISVATAHLSAATSLRAFMPVLAAAPGLSVSATVTRKAAGALTAPATLHAAPFTASASLSGAAKLLCKGQMGSAVLAAGTSVSVTAQRVLPAAGAFSAPAALTAAAGVTQVPAVHLAAPATVLAVPAVTVRAQVPLAAATALTAAPFTAAAHLLGSAVLVAPGRRTALARAALAVSPALHASAAGATQLRAPAALTAGAFLTRHAAAHLAAAAALTPHATRGVRAAAALAASPHLAGHPVIVTGSPAHLAAAPALHAAGQRALPGAAHLAAAPALAATGRRTAQPVVRLAAGAVLSAHSVETVPAGPVLTAAPALRAVPLNKIVTLAALAARSALLAGGEVSYAVPLPPVPPRLQPTWQRDVQRFAISAERQRHAQALWQAGELAIFALMWATEDLATGLAARCPRCWQTPAAPGSPEEQIAAVYGQGNQYRCTLCYGSQLVQAGGTAAAPGVRAVLVRPAIFTDTDQNQQRTAKGTVNSGEVNIQATPDFRVRTYDYCFRADGRRYQLRVPRRTTVRTGFATPWQQAAAIDYNLARAGLEDPSSVAYIVPPAPALAGRALGVYTRIPADYAWIEIVNGPLIPGESPAPAASGHLQPSAVFPMVP